MLENREGPNGEITDCLDRTHIKRSDLESLRLNRNSKRSNCKLANFRLNNDDVSLFGFGIGDEVLSCKPRRLKEAGVEVAQQDERNAFMF